MTTKMSHRRMLLVLPIAALLLAACGGGAPAATEPPPVPIDTSVPAAESTAEPEAHSVRSTYDDAGRLVAADYGSARIDYTYDNNGNLLSREVLTGQALAGEQATGSQPAAKVSISTGFAALLAPALGTMAALALVVFRRRLARALTSRRRILHGARTSTILVLIF